MQMWCHLASLSHIRTSVLSVFTIIKCYNCSYDFRVSSSPPLWSTLQILESSCSVFSPSTRRLNMHWFYFWASSPRQQSQICQSLALSSQIWSLWIVWKKSENNVSDKTVRLMLHVWFYDHIYPFIVPCSFEHDERTRVEHISDTHRLEQLEHGVKNVEFRASTWIRHFRTMFSSRSSSREENSQSAEKRKKLNVMRQSFIMNHRCLAESFMYTIVILVNHDDHAVDSSRWLTYIWIAERPETLIVFLSGCIPV